MMISSKPNEPKLLNPQAPHFYPNHHFTHLTSNYPLFNPLPPPQPPFFNIFYRHPIFPRFLPKTVYYNTQLPMLPGPEPGFTSSAGPGYTEPAGAQQTAMLGSSESEPAGSVVVRRVRKPKRRNQGGVKDSGSRRWFWFRKDVMYHPVARACDYPFGDSTSLMIRNIPVRFSRKELMEQLDEHCRKQNEKISSDDDPVSEFDFLYLPIDFKTKGNLGYAFVNFTNWQGAARLFSSWNGSSWENCPYKTKKICQINRAKFQGKQELSRHFEMSVFPCETDEYLPVVISPPRNGFNADQTSLATVGTRKFSTK